MDPVEHYRDAVMAVLRPWEQRPGPQSTLRFEAVFDRERDRYLLVIVGWDGPHHVHATLLHIDVIDGKPYELKLKVRQLHVGASTVPGIAAIIGFKKARVLIQTNVLPGEPANLV